MKLTEIKSLLEIMQRENIQELEVKRGTTYFYLKRADGEIPANPAVASAAGPVTPEVPREQKWEKILSPLSGVFYRAASPTSAPFVEEGQEVSAGKTLAIIEAMKVMNEIKAEKSCRIKKILVENGQPVSIGTELFLVE